MAYTNSPDNQTYKTVELDFTANSFYRSGNLSTQRDSNIINMYFERVANENQTRTFVLKKRPGLAVTSYSLQKTSTDQTVVGHFYDETADIVYWALDNKKVYSLNNSGTITNICTFTNTPTHVGFTSFLTTAGTRYIMMTDGTELWYNVSGAGTSTKVTDGDLPSPHQPYPIYLDGYLFLIKSSTGDIYNSNFDDPTAWTPGDFITTEITADNATRLAKVKNYLIVFGKDSIEFFYDAANLSGSPLSRNESYVQYIQYQGGFAQIGDKIFFVGNELGNSKRVYVLDGSNASPISNIIVERILNEPASTSVDSFSSSVSGYGLSVDGHNFYGLHTGRNTMLFELNDKFWYEWRQASNTADTFQLEAVWHKTNNTPWVVLPDATYISYLSPTLYQDYGSNFTCTYTTEDYNAGTFNWKWCHRVGLKCDQWADSGTSSAYISWTNSDWADGGTTPRAVNVFSNNPYITQTGRFRTRSWRITYTDNYPFRMMGLSMDLNIGTI